MILYRLGSLALALDRERTTTFSPVGRALIGDILEHHRVLVGASNTSFLAFRKAILMIPLVEHL